MTTPSKRERELAEEWTADLGYQQPYADSLARYRQELLREVDTLLERFREDRDSCAPRGDREYDECTDGKHVAYEHCEDRLHLVLEKLRGAP